MNAAERQGRSRRQKQISRIRKSGKASHFRTVRHGGFEETQIICYLWDMIKAVEEGQKTRTGAADRLDEAVRQMRRQVRVEIRRYFLRRKRRNVGTALVLAAMALSVTCLFTFVIGIDRVSGESMYPYLNHGDWIVYSRLGERVERDAVVVFEKDGENFVKRVVGLPGDTVEISMSGGRVVVNGSQVRERYVTLTDPEQKGNEMGVPLTVIDGQYLVLGDNRGVSIDSRDRDMGTVAEERILGTVILIVRTGRKPG
ncbi:MAG: signal peptidase I [Hungatella hathewayi]